MAFDTPTLEEEHEFCLAHYRTLLPLADVSPESFNSLFFKTVAAAVTSNHANVAAAKNDLIPDTASGPYLDRWASIRGVVRKGATPARKADALRIVGTAATNIPDASELLHSSGLRYMTVGANVIPVDGFVDADVVAIDVGSQTRLAKGEQLTFSVPIAGIEEIAELQLDLDEDGEDQESDGALRERVLNRFANPPLGGAANDYEQWALAELGIAAAFAYPLRKGVGSVDLAALHAGSGTARILTEGERDALEATVDAKRPVGVNFRVLTVVAEPTAIEVEITENGVAANAFDWNDLIAPVVAAWTPGTRTIQFTGNRPATMDAGDRVVIKRVDGTGTGRERIIEALAGADSIILEADATGDEPAIGDSVYSGGPLVQPVRDAIQDLVDSLGTANPDDDPYGSWEGSLDPDALSDVARDVTGVRRAYTIAPAALVEAQDLPYPNDAEIGLITASRILVRKHH